MLLIAPVLLLAQVRIMPLGDSITLGCCVEDNYGDNNAYRRALYDSLVAHGYSIDFVGGLSNGTFADINHQGMDGRRADEIATGWGGGTGVFAWLTDRPADIVLLHIGTNDISDNETVSQIITDVDNILNEIDQFSLDVYVVLALIVNRQDIEGNEPEIEKTIEFNDSLQVLANNRIANGDLLHVVDMESALNYSTSVDMDDNHPTQTGYDKMADVWLPAIMDIIDNDISLPVFLETFSAVFKNNSIHLYWKTTSEIENLGFIIERAEKGIETYEVIADYRINQELKGSGNSSVVSEYSFVDKSVQRNKHYNYKLYSISYDGAKVMEMQTSVATKLTSYNLYQNYPNPFNPSTTIKYSLDDNTYIRLIVYDITGTELTMLVDEYQPAGEYTAVFDSSGLSSGLYFYKLSSPHGQALTKSMILIK